MTIPISSHPDFPAIERTIVVNNVSIDLLSRSVSVFMSIQHHKNGQIWNNIGIGQQFIKAATNDEKFVDPATGQVIGYRTNGVAPAGGVGEYTFLYNYFEEGKTFGESLENILRFMVLRMDAGGNFNDYTLLT